MIQQFVPVPNRNYISLQPRNDEERLKLEEKLNITQQLAELSRSALQKWALRPWAETCDTVTVRCFDYGSAYIGIVFTVSANGKDFDGYAAYICPTKEDYHILEADFTKIAEESGFVAAKKP